MLREALLGMALGYVAASSNYGLPSQNIPRIVVNMPPSGISDFSIEPKPYNPVITDFFKRLDDKHRKEAEEKSLQKLDLSKLLKQI
jgi:hypothetical protein